MTARTLASLPLFPLGTVLFPGGVLPLRVFEPRYLDMVGRCHRANAPFGVVALAAGSEVRVAGAPPERLESVGTLAHIVRVRQPQPGLLWIECRGGERFRMEPPTRLAHGLWVADATVLAPDGAVAVPDDLARAVQALQRVLQDARARTASAALPPREAERWDDCGWVANRWCELLPLPRARKQQQLGVDSPLLRLELVADWLQAS